MAATIDSAPPCAFRLSRLTRPEDFRQVFATGCRSTSGPLVIQSRPNGLSQARLGLAVSKRHVRRAVDRNRIKRLARESFRATASTLAGRDIVVLVRAGPETWDKPQLRRALEAAWRQHLQRCVVSLPT